MPRGRNAKEARRARREKPKSKEPTANTRMPPSARIEEVDLHELMSFAMMTQAMQQNLGLDSDEDDDDDDIPLDYEPTYEDMKFFEAGGGWPPPSIKYPGQYFIPGMEYESDGLFETIGSAIGAVGYSPFDGHGNNGDIDNILGGLGARFSSHSSGSDLALMKAISHRVNINKSFKREECERRAKKENVKNWTVKPRTWGPSDKNNILMIQLKPSEEQDPDILSPEQIIEMVLYNDVFRLSSECPRFNVEKKLFAVNIDKPTDMNKFLKIKSLSLSARLALQSDGDAAYSHIDLSTLEAADSVTVKCSRPQAKTKDERWWEDNKKYIIVNQHTPLTFSNNQELEESHYYSTVSWSQALKMDDEFFLGLCQRCSKLSIPTEKMAVCNVCHLVVYCSKNCLKKDRNRHKKLCSKYSVNHCNKNLFERALSEVANISSPEKKKEFFFIFLNHIDSNPEALPAKLLGDENLDFIKEVCYGLKKPFFNDCLQYPLVCNVCLKTDKNKLEVCECYCVAYCSEEHRANDVKHKLVCKELLQIARVYAFRKKNSSEDQNIILPLDLEICQGVDVSSKELESMDDLVDLGNFPSGSQPDEWLDVKLASLSQRLAMPLTILNILEKGGLGPDEKPIKEVEKLNIHILCEQPSLDPSSWEFFLHRLPQLKKLNLTFCTNNTNPGGSINPLNTYKKLKRCYNCEEAGRIISFTLYPGMYEHLINKNVLEKPDLVYVVNPEDLIEPNPDDFYEEDESDMEIEFWDIELHANQKIFYRNITKFENAGLIITNECQTKMFNNYKSVCKVSSVEMVNLKGFEYNSKNPFCGFSPIRRKFENRSHKEAISNHQSYMVYLVKKPGGPYERESDAYIWKWDEDEDITVDKPDPSTMSNLSILDDTSDESDLPDLVRDDDSEGSDIPELLGDNASEGSDMPELIDEGKA